MARGSYAWAAAGVLTAVTVLNPLAPPRAVAQSVELVLFPKTLVDRAIEARTAADIAKDNDIVLQLNGLTAQLGTVRASTLIYEQRLVVTGLFDDKAIYDKFEKGVRAMKGVKSLYWHVIYMPKKDQERRELLGWPEVVALETKASVRLIGASGVADVNFRVAGDSSGTLYLLGRARSGPELSKAAARARDGDGVRKLLDYVEVRS